MHSIYINLLKQTELVTRMFGFHILIVIVAAFAVLASELYHCYSYLKDQLESVNLFLNIYFSLQWATCQLLELYIIVYLSNNVHDQVRS